MGGHLSLAILCIQTFDKMNIRNSSVIWQKSKSQNGYFKKTKHTKFSEKTNISYSQIRARTCAYQAVRNVRFLENFACFVFCFVFLKHPFWDLPFCFITDQLFYYFHRALKFKKTLQYFVCGVDEFILALSLLFLSTLLP